jgi:hypothetical protein
LSELDCAEEAVEDCCDESDEAEFADELSDWFDVVEASDVFEFVDEFCD